MFRLLPSIALLLVCSAGAFAKQSESPASNDWVATGWDCTLFAAGDIDGDGFDDVITINGNRDLCVAYTVQGWKAASWEVLAGQIPTEAVGLFAANAKDDWKGIEVIVVMGDHLIVHGALENGTFSQSVRLDLPAHVRLDTHAALAERHSLVEGNETQRWIIADGVLQPFDLKLQTPRFNLQLISIEPPPFELNADALTTFVGDINGDAIPDQFAVYSTTRPHQHRVVRVAISPNAASTDKDADGLSDEQEQAIGSNPFDRDTDDDGLLDGWEVHGLPREIKLAEGDKLNPLRQDVIIAVSRYEQVDQKAMEGELPRAAELYRKLPNKNPDSSTGIDLHFVMLEPVVADQQHGGSWQAVGNEQLRPECHGFMHWMQITPGGGGQAMQTGDMGGCGCGWAVFAHEFGHQMSLSHEGDSAPPWCPLYPSLMNYAFSYSIGGDGNAIHFSDGKFASISLDESKLQERLPFAYADLKYLETGPFRFTLKDDQPNGTLIDWNQNGTFDEGTVSADINYGGSTNGGIRRNHDLIGAAPVFCYVGNTCHLITINQQMADISIKNYLGEEKWSDPRKIPNSAADSEPVVLGLDDHGLVFFRRNDGWRVARFTADTTSEPIHLADLPKCDLSVGRVNGRVLLVSRYDDDRLEARWLDWNEKPVLTSPWLLELKSQVPVAMTQHPVDKRLGIVTSIPNSRGGQMCMRLTWLAPAGDKLVQQETIWTRGEASNNNCTTRPVISITDDGQLYIFHTGWPDGSGQMTAWRTKQISNKALDEGWLTCMMYDIWTRTRVGVAFANGPQGAIYAYRWDSGEYGETHINHLQVAHNGLGIDREIMRDHDDSGKMSLWGIRHSILNVRR